MRVLFLAHEAFGGRGGIAKFNRDMITALCSHPDVSQVVGIPRIMPDHPGQLPRKFEYVTWGIGNKFAYAIAVGGTLLRRRRFDVIVYGHINLLAISALAGMVGKHQKILTTHGVEIWHAPRHRMIAGLVGKVDMITAVSRFTRDKIRSWATVGDDQIAVLHNCIEVSDFGPKGNNSDLAGRLGLVGKTVLMSLARLDARERYKGIDEVIALMPELAHDRPDLVYVVGGNGTDRPRLETKARELGVADRIIFAGYIPAAEKADLLRTANAFILAGHGEGFGIVLLEAMACGVPVIASKLDASREAVQDGALGVLVDPTDRTDLRRGIEEALARPPGIVPAGLDDFSYSNFEGRVHGLIDGLSPNHADR